MSVASIITGGSVARQGKRQISNKRMVKYGKYQR